MLRFTASGPGDIQNCRPHYCVILLFSVWKWSGPTSMKIYKHDLPLISAPTSSTRPPPPTHPIIPTLPTSANLFRWLLSPPFMFYWSCFEDGQFQLSMKTQFSVCHELVDSVRKWTSSSSTPASTSTTVPAKIQERQDEFYSHTLALYWWVRKWSQKFPAISYCDPDSSELRCVPVVGVSESKGERGNYI